MKNILVTGYTCFIGVNNLNNFYENSLKKKENKIFKRFYEVIKKLNN